MTTSGFTQAAWQVMDLARADARARGHPRVGTGHILRGLVLQGDGVAAQVLGSLGVTLARAGGLAEHGRRARNWRPHRRKAPLALTAAAERVIELACEETRKSVDTEHILAALVREPAGPATHILEALGARPWKVRRQLARALSAHEGIGFPEHELPSLTLPRLPSTEFPTPEELKRINELRLARAKFRREIQDDPAKLLLEPPPALATLPVLSLLLKNLGRVATNRALTACRISPSKKLGELSRRQREELSEFLRHRSSAGGK